MSAQFPVAIVGIGCRLPGGSDTKELYYEFLRNKGDGMSEPPPDRWDHKEWGSSRPDEPGKYNTSMCGFINAIDHFDTLEFGISMKEAQQLDPSSRLILEVAHLALLDSGIDYRGSNTGVYIGQLLISASELGNGDRYEVSSYQGLGKCISLRSNRVSFTFDLRGPSLMVDTACSSSATAMHMAMSAIKLGEIDQALIIGGNVIAQPVHNVMFSKTGILSPTGSSKSFDAAADGYARAEGFGAILIKRLDKALVDGDTVYSVITGSSINSNGKGVSLTMPKGNMQAETIRQAYCHANRKPSEAFFVELHATGTSVGDPIEANTVGQVFSEERNPDKVLRIGSVKSNIGHTEGCSFLASLIKVSLMLKHKEIIPNIRFNNPNPKIDFKNGLMKVQTELEQITPEQAAADGKWIASVASSGIGGSNSHVVLETLETVTTAGTVAVIESPPTASDQLYLFVVAALTGPTILRWKDALTESYQDVTDDRILRSLSYDLARKSRSCPARSFAVGRSLSPDLNFSQVVISNADVNPKLCLVFSGQGPQHVAMGRELCAAFPVFLSAVKQCDEILVESYGQESFLERTGLFISGERAKVPEKDVWPIEEVVYSIVFIQLAFVDLIKSLGIEYSYAIGHSIGEIALGYASGHYSKRTAIGIAAARATAMAQVSGNGSMAALGACYHRAKYMIKQIMTEANVDSGLWIAAINSPRDVTIAGDTKLIDMLVTLAQGRKIFVAKLKVTCAFHTPLMDLCEPDFRRLAKLAFTDGLSTSDIRPKSTVDGNWLDRDMDENYCWDNIRQPVLFGKAVDDMVKEMGPENVVFLEISPHPVLQAYITHCGGKAFSLVRRPNPKTPAKNTGEYQQLLEGIGSLLAAGFKTIDFAKLCATPDGQQDLIQCKLPEYPYNRSKCWSESASDRSMRLREKRRPLASTMFRLNCDTHPDLTGHVIFERPIFPASGYIESILEIGAMVVKKAVIHRPLVLGARGTDPGHVGVLTDKGDWEFRVATSNTYDNGYIKLDTVYADGSYLDHNPEFDPDEPKRFDIDSKLALSRCSITGEEFYQAIPSIYGYCGNFSSYIKQIHELPDDDSWGGTAYLIKFEIPEDDISVHDSGYVIHPSLLDSIMHSTLAAFIDMDTKSFDFTETLLPVRIEQITRWDKGDNSDLDLHFPGTIWAYLTISTWSPTGPCISNLTVTDSESLVLFTIEGMECAVAPQEQFDMDECFTTIWQPKAFPTIGFTLPSAEVLSTPSYISHVFEVLIANAQAAGRHVVRILDLDVSSLIAKAVGDSLVSIPSNQLLVDYFLAGVSPEDADEKARAMSYPRARPFVLDPTSVLPPEEANANAQAMSRAQPSSAQTNAAVSPQEAEAIAQAMARARQGESDPNSGEYDMAFGSFDILFQVIDASISSSDVDTLLQYLAPFGVILLLYNPNPADKEKSEGAEAEKSEGADVEKSEGVDAEKSGGTDAVKSGGTDAEKSEVADAEKSEGVDAEKSEGADAEKSQGQQALKLTAFQHIPEQDISVANLATGETLILVRTGAPIKEDLTSDVVIHHFTRGTEEELVDIVNKLPENAEIWILGDDSAIGIGALGIAACIIAESPNFTVHSLLFENVSLNEETREQIVRALRRMPSLLEQHLKYSVTGDIYVRRLVYHPIDAQPSPAPGVMIESPLEKAQISAYFPPTLKATDVQVSIDHFGVDDISADKPSVAFVGKVSHIGAEVTDISTTSKVVGIAKHPITNIVVLDKESVTVLPSDMPDCDAVALPIMTLVPWLALAEHAPISSSSVILLHNASTHVGFGAVQLCQRFGAKFFCTVPTPADGKRLSDELNVDEQAIATSLLVNDTNSAVQTWLSENKLCGFDIVFNLLGGSINATILNLLTVMGQYIHNKSNSVDQVNIPSGAPITRVIDVPKLVESHPSKLASSLTNLLTAHTSVPFKLQSQSTAVSQLSSSTPPCVPKSEVLVVAPDIPKSIHLKSGQLFNPRKSYILVGGSSELGVRISVWMATRGARHIILTSRRGPAALGKMDKVYLRHLQSMEVSVDIIAADARNGEAMTGVIVHAAKTAPIGGIFLMAVVSHDGMFSRMKQESFDNVYFSKVISLHTLLHIINPAVLDFLLLFSTIGSVFGNAGQSAYCASQLYLDRIAESLPNTVSISLPPISDSGMFKRLLQSTKGRSSSKTAMKIGVTTAQACDFIADSIIRQISHYVPAITMKHVPLVFSACEPLLYNHLLPTRFLVKEMDNENRTIETPASLLCELLGLSMDKITDDITLKDYGLDSLGAIRYSKELAGHFGIKVGQLELLGSMNIGLLNEMVASSSKFGNLALEDDEPDIKYISAPETNLVKRIAYGEMVSTNASRLQSRIWLSYVETQKQNGNADGVEHTSSHPEVQCKPHGLFMTINSTNDIDIVRVREAFAEVVQRHGALRTAFFLNQGSLEQCVYPFLDFEINVVDLKAEASPEGKAYEMSLDVCDELELTLEKLPLFRATVFDLGNNEWSFSFVSHHIVMDKGSLGLIFHEVLTLYYNGPDSLEPQDMHLSDFSDWLSLTSDHRAELLKKQREFWIETLKDAQPAYLMSSTPSEEPLSDLTEIEVTVDASTLALCHSLMKEVGATPAEGFFAVYNTLLCNHSSQQMMIVGTAAAQRNTPLLANVVGPLSTFLPIKTTVDPNQTFQEYLTGFKEDLSKSLENGGVIYEDIHPDIPDPSQCCKHSFSYNEMNLDAISELEIEGLQVKNLRSLSKIKDERQELILDIYGKTGRIILQFNNHLFSEENARSFLDRYIALVEAVCRSPDSKMCDLSMFNPGAEPTTPVTTSETDPLLTVTDIA